MLEEDVIGKDTRQMIEDTRSLRNPLTWPKYISLAFGTVLAIGATAAGIAQANYDRDPTGLYGLAFSVPFIAGGLAFHYTHRNAARRSRASRE